MRVSDFLNGSLVFNRASNEKNLKVEFDNKKLALNDGFRTFLKTYGYDIYEPSNEHDVFFGIESSSRPANDTGKVDLKEFKENKQSSFDNVSTQKNVRYTSKEGEYVDERKFLRTARSVSEKKFVKLNDSDVPKGLSVVEFRQGENQRKVFSDKGNLEMYLVSLVRVISEVGKLSEIPFDLRQRISEIRAKILEGKVNIAELSNLLAEVKKLSNSSEVSQKINLKLDSLIREFEQVLNKLNGFSSTSESVFVDKSSEGLNSSRIIVNDYRQSEIKNTERREAVRNDSVTLTTPVRSEIIKSFNVSQQVVSNVQNNFFVQFNMLSNAISEFSGRLVINLRNNVNEMKMTLFPPELGRVSVKFESTSDGRLVGSIVVSSREAYTLFQEHLSIIKDNLMSQGFNVVRLDINLDSTLGGFGFSNERFNRGEGNQIGNIVGFFKFDKEKEEYELLSKASSDYHEGVISLYA